MVPSLCIIGRQYILVGSTVVVMSLFLISFEISYFLNNCILDSFLGHGLSKCRNVRNRQME